METQNQDSSSVPPTSPGSGSNNTLMGILAYLGILVIIPLLTHKGDQFVKFHAKQGLVLFICEVVIWTIGMSFFWSLFMIMNLINLAVVVLSILGIVNVVNGQMKELPLIGSFAKHFNF